MKKITFLFLVLGQMVFAQKQIQPTDKVIIEGLVEQPITITLEANIEIKRS